MDFYCGNVLRIDLSRAKVEKQPLDMQWARLYVGGKGLLSRYLFSEVPVGADALGEENCLVIATGVFAGTSLSTCSRVAIGFKSPQTGTYVDSYVGGSLGPEMKFAGYDLILLKGVAKEPTVVWISDDDVALLPASEYWGMHTSKIEAALREDLDPQAKILSIGVGGENLVPWACASVDQYHKAGRGGAGAVLGSKRVKALAIRGTGAVKVGDAKRFLDHTRSLHSSSFLVDTHLWAYEEGTPVLVDVMNGGGAMPTRNFSEGQSTMAANLNSSAFKRHRVKKRACYQCVMACRNVHQIGGVTGEGPEYETIAVCGPNCGIGDLEALAQFNSRCDELGLDTVSTGVVTALAMDLTEKGVHDYGLKFGDVEGYLAAPELMARREGIGADLALGAKGLARLWGHPELAFEAKNMEYPGYDPRASFGMALAYATSDRGACHMRAYPAMDEVTTGMLPADSLVGKAQYNVDGQNISSARWTGIFCDFWFPSAEVLAEVMEHVWNKAVSPEEILRLGERIWNLGRLFNLREGTTAADDTVCSTTLTQPLVGTGPAVGKIIGTETFQAAIQEYYSLRGWDDRGVPTEEKLVELEVDVRVPTLEGTR